MGLLYNFFRKLSGCNSLRREGGYSPGVGCEIDGILQL